MPTDAFLWSKLVRSAVKRTCRHIQSAAVVGVAPIESNEVISNEAHEATGSWLPVKPQRVGYCGTFSSLQISADH